MFDLVKFRFRRDDETGWMIGLILMGILWSALVAGSMAWGLHQQKQSILNAAATAARTNINKDQSFRKWTNSHGGVYVPTTEHTPPNPYLKVPDRDVVTTTGKTLTLMNHAYVLRQMQSDFPDNYGTKSHITSLKPLNPNNAPDAWEAKALHAFEQGNMEFWEAQQIDGQPYLRMMLPFIVEQSCLKCHAQQGYQLGDIRDGISSAVSLAPFMARERKFGVSLILAHGAAWLIGLAGLVWLGISFRRVQRLETLARSAAAVAESERRFRAVAQSANDTIISADSIGKVVGWNAAAERLFGYTEAEIIGQPLTVLMPERFRTLHSEGLVRMVAGGMPHVIGKTVEVFGLRKDGSELPVELSLAQWQAADGQFFTAIIRDITKRKQTEQALQESESNYRRLIENSPDIVYTFSAKRGSIYCSSQVVSILGYSVEHLYAHPFLWNESIHPEDRAVVAKAIEEFKTGSPFKIEYRIKNAHGDWRWFYDRAIGGREENGDFIIEGLAMDITERKQMEEALRISALKHQLLFESSRDALMILAPPSWKFTEANEMTLQLFGVSSVAEFTALGPWDVSPERQPDGRPSGEKAQEMIATAMREGSHSFEWEHQRLDGQPFAADVLLTRMELGKEVFVQATVRDITERKRIEERLRASEQKFMQFFMQLPIPLVIVNKDGVMARFNDRFTEVLGYTTDDVPTIDEWWQRAYPNESYRQWVLDTWNAAVAKAAKEGVEIEPLEYKVTGKSGAERIMIVGGITIEDNLLATLIDITERKQVEERIRKSETRYRSIFEYSNDIIYLLNMDGTINSLSPAFEQITGWTAEEWIGKSFTPIVHPDDLSVANTAFQKTLSGETFPIFRLRIARKSGQYFYADFSITPFDHDVIMGVARDVSERQFAEEEIRKLNEELETKVQERTQQLLRAQEELVRKEKLAVLGQVAGSVGHELRNPLGVMSNAVYFLQTVLTDADDTTKEYLNIIKSEIAGSERIVSDLLDSVRTQPPQPEIVSVAELIEQTLRKCRVPSSVTVKLDIPETLSPLRVDAQQIHQVLRNLISNGVEAMPEGGTLEIRAVENKPDGTITVSVRDSGTGIAPDVLPKLFQPLFTTKARGIGLGLVVVKNLTEANGGTVKVESEAGKGTQFAITLPAVDERGVSI